MDLDAGHGRNERERNRGHIGNKGYQRVVVLRGSTFRALADWPHGRRGSEQEFHGAWKQRANRNPAWLCRRRSSSSRQFVTSGDCSLPRFVRLMPFRLITFAPDARTWATTACVARVARALHHRLVNRRKAGARRSVPRQVR